MHLKEKGKREIEGNLAPMRLLLECDCKENLFDNSLKSIVAEASAAIFNSVQINAVYLSANAAFQLFICLLSLDFLT